MSAFLPYSRPDIGEAEIEAVTATMRSGWLTTGPAAAAFEREFAEYVGSDEGGIHAIAVNSATAGLHLALEALGIGPEDEVIVPTWTFTATAEVIRYLGATPVIVDVDPVTLNIDLDDMAAAVGPRTRAVIVVHLAGLSLDMSRVRSLLAGTEIKIIEDAAHALPSSTGGTMVGSLKYSDVAVFSFYANKTMTTGEGGMITTRDPKVAERARVMRLHGIDRSVFDRYSATTPSWAYDVVAPGFKYNLPDPAAALGRVQLARARDMRDKRASTAGRYLTGLAGLPLTPPHPGAPHDLHSWHLFVVRLTSEAPINRARFIQEMSTAGIGTSVHFIPLHRHSYWREFLGLDHKRYPVAEAAFRAAVSLPIFSRMTDADTQRVIETTRDLLS
ncbi:DegT/DnrJ/EryC1/StrS family aminotransferase [Pseudactinotalea terrae]|uniref:DegT/DnrJ/EryC1/StrS family aminotransferase n=1 Tax=Pseudactinotalea terrae TaxID=1743262 RepID=UPI0012E24327|nr:DegT/DnrJ/EryC1/StrS family aminotransferase [Pseudactinotalea terrae]